MRKSQFFGVLFVLSLFILSGCSKSPTVNSVKTPDDFIGEVKEFTVEAFQFGFDPAVIEVNQGDKVRIIASSRDVPHGLALPEFGVNLYLDGLSSQTAEFIADKKGTFTFYCSVPCGRGHGQMRGKLIVK